ncbi:MAG: hypothetical protein RLY71_4593 [Pseudomonadota bacterium]|jgi:hypothetical protein
MNTSFLAHLVSATKVPAVPAESGRAFVIQVEPDLAAGERINVGVAAVTADGRRLTRMLTDYGRVTCFYGAEVAELVETLADFGRAAALSGSMPPGPSIVFTTAQPFFGVTPEHYLEQLFDRVVPAGRPKQGHREHVVRRDTDALWREVGNIIKLRIPDRAEEILASAPMTTVQAPNDPRPIQVCVPLTPPGGAGALESADFSSEVTKRKLMTALLDIQKAAEAKHLDRMGLFIARPRRARHQADLQAIDNAIDFVACRVPSQCRVEVETDAERLADHIIDWSGLIAA